MILHKSGNPDNFSKEIEYLYQTNKKPREIHQRGFLENNARTTSLVSFRYLEFFGLLPRLPTYVYGLSQLLRHNFGLKKSHRS